MRLIAIIWLVAILAQAFSKNLIILDYHLNRHYIATHLCENRNKPQLHCEGKCFLKKQLEKDHHRDATSNSSDKNLPDVVYSDEHDDLQLPLSPEQRIYFPVCTAVTLHPSLKAVFHPPAYRAQA